MDLFNGLNPKGEQITKDSLEGDLKFNNFNNFTFSIYQEFKWIYQKFKWIHWKESSE